MLMRRTRPDGFLLASLLLLLLRAEAAAVGPTTVSPGDPSRPVPIEDGCPTFSWSTAPEADGYELAVYLIATQSDQGVEMEPVLSERFAGTASTWTPPLGRCLERGADYAWSVRVLRRGAAPEWSPPALFRVVSGPTRAELTEVLAEVHRYLRNVGEVPTREADESVPGRPGAAPRPPAAALGAAATGDPSLIVNDSAVVTTATLAASVAAQLCLALDYRYVDRGDGTVLDCSTNRLWLKNAHCFGSTGFEWDTAVSLAANLASGQCGLSDGSVAGQWRLPTLRELCSSFEMRDDPALCPPSAASTSLIDSSVGGSRKLVNAKGDGSWAEGDAFDAVQIGYWSVTVFQGEGSGLPREAWYVRLSDGMVLHAEKYGTYYNVWPTR